MSNYLQSVGALAAHLLRSTAEQRAARKLLESKSRGALRRMAGPPPAPSFTTFPNDAGNYRAKRKERPQVAPLAPRERFVRMAAAYQEFAYRRRAPAAFGL